jgi:hypothetical protein
MNNIDKIINRINKLPEILYKYRNWSIENHRKLLVDNEIYLSSARNFNDPYDCALPIDFNKLTNRDLEKYYYDASKRNQPQLDCKQRKKLSKELVLKARNRFPQLFEEFKRLQIEKNYSDFGVFSLTEDKSNIAMWSYYSDSHRGFCVGFDIKKLAEYLIHLAIERKQLIDIFKVKYSRKYPRLNPIRGDAEDIVIKPLITKSKIWQHEKEYRLLAIHGTNIKMNFPDEIFKEIIFGVRITEDTKNDIIKIIKNKQQSIKLYQSRISENKFKIEFEKIEY